MYVFLKRCLDIFVAVLLLVLTSPLLLISALLLYIFQGRPVLFYQRRIGMGGQPFLLFKFRTMRDGMPAHYHDRPVAKQPGDTRITPLGSFMRRFALDELPQLINVLRGEMSMVGPRPLPEEDLLQPGWLSRLDATERQRRLDWLSLRQQVLPGLTGRWQISAQSEDDFNNWVESDNRYVATRSIWQDLYILLFTPYAVLRGRQQPSRLSMPGERQAREDQV